MDSGFLLGYYLHDFDPYIFRISGNFGARWYGFAYVLAFLFGFLILRALARRGYSQLEPSRVSDFITWTALFGVLLGGRLGYMLLYRFDDFVSNPATIVTGILQGGMASHGGILGVFFFAWFYARRHHLSWPGIGDDLVVVAPLGIFFGRVANFINGELYGRITAVRWAVLFPKEIEALPEQEVIQGAKAAAPDTLGQRNDSEILQALVDTTNRPPEVEACLRAVLNPRHPSQIYQALLEGLLLFLILLAVRLKWRRLPYGFLTGLFFILYPIFRIFVEQYRQPDHDVSFILGLTRGQFYSTFMVVIGAAFLTFALRKGWRDDSGVSSPSSP